MASGEKRKSVFLSISDKLKVLERLEAGCSVRSMAEEYGVGLSTVKDLKKNKEKLRSFSQKFEAGSNAVKSRKTMRMTHSEAIDVAVYKWYIQHKSSGITVQSNEIIAAANRFARQLKLKKFAASATWLWRFRHRYNLTAVSSVAQNDTDDAEVDPFRQKLKEIIEQSRLSLAQLYNFDETGLFYRMMPESMLASKLYETEEEQKLSKEKLSALLCANANGSHRLKAVIVGKHRQPCTLKKYQQQLPVHYYHKSGAWFTWDIVQDWFLKHAEPEIRRFQIEELKITPDDVCALILMDKAPVHIDSDVLTSHDGRIKCLFIPPNVSLMQPMEHGIILSTKRLYRKKLLDEVLVLRGETAEENYILGPRPFANFKNYSLKAAIYNFADAWRDMPQTTLVNSWKRLLNNSDVQWEMEGIEVADFLKAFIAAGRTEVTEARVSAWLEEDEVDPGYHILTEEEIIKDVMESPSKDAFEDESDEGMEESKKIRISTIRNHCDTILTYIDTTEDPAIQQYYEQFRNFREIIIRRQQRNALHTNVHNFFHSPNTTLPPTTPEKNNEEMIQAEPDSQIGFF